MTASRSNIRFATTTPTSPPATWAQRPATAGVRVSTRPRTRSATVTTGLNDADTGWRARISATSTAPVARLFSSSWSPTSSGDSRCAAMPEPTTAQSPGTPCRRARPTARRPDATASRRTTPPSSAARSASAPGVHPVVDPDAALLAVEQAGLVQHLEVVADRRLRQVERVLQVADAGLAVGVRGDQGQQPQPDRVGERLEQRRDPLGLVGVERLAGQRRAARDGLDGGEFEQRLRPLTRRYWGLCNAFGRAPVLITPRYMRSPDRLRGSGRAAGRSRRPRCGRPRRACRGCSRRGPTRSWR